jgi:hypothetical protein
LIAQKKESPRKKRSKVAEHNLEYVPNVFNDIAPALDVIKHKGISLTRIEKEEWGKKLGDGIIKRKIRNGKVSCWYYRDLRDIVKNKKVHKN